MPYMSGTRGVEEYFGCTTSPIANIPPPFFPSKQWENTFFTLLAEASCDNTDEFDCPNPIIPSTDSSDEPSSPDCLAPHLHWFQTNINISLASFNKFHHGDN